MGISTAELVQMRNDTAAIVLPLTCTISYETVTNTDGLQSRSEVTRGTAVCALAVESRASQDNAILADREASAAFYTLSVAWTTTIEAEDKVVVNGHTYRVITLHDNQAFGTLKRALVEETS